MTQKYFINFPTIEYSNTIVRDVTRRVVFPASLKTIDTIFYPYDLQNDQRSDVVAYNYYKDTDADWLIYLTNAVIDPYYGWYLDNDQFQSHIIDKYGNLTDPQQRIKYWVTNWVDDDRQATVAYYNAQPINIQKYWVPVWDRDNRIIYYTRRQEDWFMNTNQIWTIQVANNSGFSIGDLVISNTTHAVVEGQAEVFGLTTNNQVIIKNIANNFSVGSSLQQMFGANSSVISNVSITVVNISLAEGVYWEPLTVFQYENSINEQNKSLMLLDNRYLNQAATALKQNLNQ